MALFMLCACGQLALDEQPSGGAAAEPGKPSLRMFAGDTGQPWGWEQLLAAMAAADVVVIGESHTDAQGHAIQAEIIGAAVKRRGGLTLSLEEYDRAQQAVLDAYTRNEVSVAELQAAASLVMPVVRDNWADWYFPKIAVARQGGAALLAANAPLKYSRLVRNRGCDNLPELGSAELALFDCPLAPADPVYKARFVAGISAAFRSNRTTGLKAPGSEQTDKMFRAQRVWDATMAASIVAARHNSAHQVLQVVGSVHSDFNGGLIQELRYRDAGSRMLVISMVPKYSLRLADADRGRADIVIYTSRP